MMAEIVASFDDKYSNLICSEYTSSSCMALLWLLSVIDEILVIAQIKENQQILLILNLERVFQDLDQYTSAYCL